MTRALWASLGAGMSIVLTGALVLAAVSTVVAFRGWPGATGSQPSTPAAMLADSAAVIGARPVSASAPIVVPDASLALTDAGNRTRRSSGTATGLARTVTAGTTAGDVVAGGGPLAGNGQTTGFATAGKPAVRAPKLTDGVRDTGTTLGTGATQAVGDVGDTVAPVSPQLDQTVDAVGQVLGDTVQGVTNTVADVVDGLLTQR